MPTDGSFLMDPTISRGEKLADTAGQVKSKISELGRTAADKIGFRLTMSSIPRNLWSSVIPQHTIRLQAAANNRECDNPRCPSGSAYSIPNANPMITSTIRNDHTPQTALLRIWTQFMRPAWPPSSLPARSWPERSLSRCGPGANGHTLSWPIAHHPCDPASARQ